MTGQTINLRRARKARARAEKRARTEAETRASALSSGTEGRQAKAENKLNVRRLEAHRRDEET
ncbi:hypothetical protein ACW9UR_22230 [Halovulum sp. GXIMD14794]